MFEFRLERSGSLSSSVEEQLETMVEALLVVSY